MEPGKPLNLKASVSGFIIGSSNLPAHDNASQQHIRETAAQQTCVSSPRCQAAICAASLSRHAGPSVKAFLSLGGMPHLIHLMMQRRNRYQPSGRRATVLPALCSILIAWSESSAAAGGRSQTAASTPKQVRLIRSSPCLNLITGYDRAP